MNCGKEVTEDDPFCMGCGAKQESAISAAAEKSAVKPQTTQLVENVEKPVVAAVPPAVAAAAAPVLPKVEPVAEVPRPGEAAASPIPAAAIPVTPAPVTGKKKKGKKGLIVGLVIFLVLAVVGSAGAWWFYSEIKRDGQSFTDFYLWQMGLKEWNAETPLDTTSDSVPDDTITEPIKPPASVPLSKPLSKPVSSTVKGH